MSRRVVGWIVLLLVSEVIGIVAGHWFYGLYVGSIPDPLKAQTAMQGTRLMFWLNGLLLGLVVFVWTLAAQLVVRLFRPPAENP